MKHIWLFIVAFGFSFYAQAQLATKYSNEFLAIGVGARGLAMGQGQSACANDVTAGYWNPAGLLQLSSGTGQLGLMHTSYFSGIANLDYAAMATRLKGKKESAMGISLIRFGIDGIPDTRYLFTSDGRLDYNNVSSFSAADHALIISYARKLWNSPFWSGGANMKIVRRKAGSFANAWGFGLDVALQYRKNRISFGIVARDISTTYNVWSINAASLADVFQQTGNDVPLQSTEITLPSLQTDFGYRKPLGLHASLLLNAGAHITFDGKRSTLVNFGVGALSPRVSAELMVKEKLSLRAGLTNFQRLQGGFSSQPSIGVGFKFAEASIDYALIRLGERVGGLYSHVLSLNIGLKKQATQKKQAKKRSSR